MPIIFFQTRKVTLIVIKRMGRHVDHLFFIVILGIAGLRMNQRLFFLLDFLNLSCIACVLNLKNLQLILLGFYLTVTGTQGFSQRMLVLIFQICFEYWLS
jgi:hypothetical protein